jgi:hypothetical protein
MESDSTLIPILKLFKNAYLVRRIPEANPSSSDSADNHDHCVEKIQLIERLKISA